MYGGTLITKTIRVLRIVKALSRSEKLLGSGFTGVFEVSLTIGFFLTVFKFSRGRDLKQLILKSALKVRSRKRLSQLSGIIKVYILIVIWYKFVPLKDYPIEKWYEHIIET